MGTNIYFQNYFNSGEQRLIEDLICESIRIYGIDIHYLARTVVSRDDIFREADQVKYESAHMCEVYIRDVNGFTGDSKFLSKFGLEIRDEMTFTFAQRSFSEEIGAVAEINRPREGDLIYFPLNGKVFQIKFVDPETIFYQLGALQIYDCVCEVFEFSNERFSTGIPYIDDKYNYFLTDLEDYELLTEDGYVLCSEDGEPLITDNPLNNDNNDQSDEFQEEADEIIDFTEIDPFSEGKY